MLDDRRLRAIRGSHVALLWIGFVGAYLMLNATELSFSIPTVQAHSGGHTILNVLPYYDADLAYEHLASYDPVAVAAYHRILLLDVVLLIPLYVLALGTGLGYASCRVLTRLPRVATALPAVPLLAGALNLVEDTGVLVLLSSHPVRHDALASVVGVLTALKTASISAALVASLALFAVVASSRLSYRLGLRGCHV